MRPPKLPPAKRPIIWQQGDYFVISPAEKWQAFLDLSKPGFNAEIKRVAVATTEWELTAQHSGHRQRQ